MTGIGATYYHPCPLDPLLDGDIDRIARGVIRRELAGSSAGAGQIEDLLAEVRLRLVRTREGIENLEAYAAVVARNACYSFLRARFPERTRLRNRIRYAAGHHPGTTIERDALGIWRCSSRLPARLAPAAGSAARFIDDPRGWIESAGLDAGVPLPALVNALLATLDRPIELDRLADGLATVLGVVDAPSAPASADTARDIPDPTPPVSASMEQRESLGQVWAEIIALPPRQRAALLLNLRDPDGGGAILALLPDTGVASMADIAAAAGLEVQALQAVWDQLPLDDLTIAERMGLSRQQVINLRKSARARLARRLSGVRS